MATIVLSSIGAALGGPVGGAIGSLVGQQIDRSIMGGGTVRGPRLGDLSVQTSNYGALIPRIYGRMRVAGTVIWSTDLKERKRTSSGGKGQPSTTSYSYSVSLAVALSSRPVEAVGRIWADGKLIRDANGKFSVKTEFRLHPGDEWQEADPDIATIEGIAQTPAYRGLAVAVFEELHLADFGNRIPMLTFEVIADEAPTVGTILSDATDDLIRSRSAHALIGYAAHGGDRRAAIEPLVDALGLQLVEQNGQLGDAEDGDGAILRSEHQGAGHRDHPQPRVERVQAATATLPGSLTLTYYEESRDFQSGQAHASIRAGDRRNEHQELPAVMAASDARPLAEAQLSRRWASRERLTVRLPLSYLDLRTGERVTVSGETGEWRISEVTIDTFVVVVTLIRLVATTGQMIPSDPGRANGQRPIRISPTRLAILDVPIPGPAAVTAPQILVAAGNEAPGWRTVPVDVEIGGAVSSIDTAATESVFGSSVTVLGPCGPAVLDLAHSVDIDLLSDEMLLENCDDDALAAGQNLAALGNELLQFGRAEQLGARRYRLSRLLRGRLGTEWAAGAHVSGEAFVMLQGDRLTSLLLPHAAIGATLTLTPGGLGDQPSPVPISAPIAGESLRPPSPVHFEAELSGAGLSLKWARRSRQGWQWSDGVDVPLAESREQYRVEVTGGLGSLLRDVDSQAVTFASAELAAIGAPVSATVVQVGDFAVSRPATQQISV